MIADSSPSPLWFATRGLGTVCLVILTAVVILGVVTSVRSEAPLWPRYLTAGLHRNLSLLGLVLIALHVLTSILDPYAHLGVRDALVPFGSSYRPFWLGLGVVATDILLALIVTSMLRPWLGHGLWRGVHWLAYISWPVALLHGLGTGTDTRVWWSVGISGACLVAVAMAAAWRLDRATPRFRVARRVGGTAIPIACIALAAWAARGPMAPGWAQASGTPTGLGADPAPPSAAASPGAGINDIVSGRVVTGSAQHERIVLEDTADRSLLLLVSPASNGSTPSLVIYRSGSPICSVAITASGNTLDGMCGSTRVTVYLSGDQVHISGQLVTSGPLR